MSKSEISILCVDDDTIPRTLRVLVLQKQGYRVIPAASGMEALEALANDSFNLVLTDQMMPGMTGTELTKRVKAENPRMPVIIVSGVNDLPTDAEFADRFISKIEGPAALLLGINEVLEQYSS